GFHAIADNINRLTCLLLPRELDDYVPIIATAIDYINNQEYNAEENDYISIFDPNFVKTDPEVITEYDCLILLNNANL
ncbi:19007_t:CDS:2, partial [Gigaspora rosea]